MLAGEILAVSAARWPSATAVIEGERRLDYRTLDRRANRIAHGLAAAGLGRGVTVGVLSPNGLDYPALFFGLARSGALQAHFSIRYTAADLAALIERTRLDALFAHADLVPLLRAAPRARPITTIVLGDPAGGLAPGEVAFERFLAGQDEAPPKIPLDDSDEFAITFTGGTTGVPKGVVVTHQARTAVSLALHEPFAMGAGVVTFLATPLFHVAGLFSWHLTAIAGGATLALMPKWEVADFIARARRHGARQGLMVPTQVVELISHPDYGPSLLPNLRLLNYGGAPMPEAVLERGLEMHREVAMLEHYGQSEAGAIAWRPPEAARARKLSVGRPFPFVELGVRDGGGAVLPHGATGEIAVRGPGVFARYWDDPEETAKAFTADRWLKTGDIGHVDGTGYLFLVDRAKDMIISGGENIYPAEIEKALAAHPAVRECAVFGIPDAHWGELPAAHVVLAEGAHVTETELIDFVAQRIPRHKRPRLVKFVASLPKTAVGKVEKRLIREPYWRSAARSSDDESRGGGESRPKPDGP